MDKEILVGVVVGVVLIALLLVPVMYIEVRKLNIMEENGCVVQVVAQ